MDLRCRSSRHAQSIIHVEGKTIRITVFVDAYRGTPIPIELRKGELAAPLCWYKVMVLGIGDDKGVPAQNISMSILAFFGPALEDYVALAALAIPTIQKLCSHLTVKEFHTNHWAQTHNPTR
ncbi:epoxide hydrolase [Moniliophthora roreri MCA 2997]|uniref:Epoxide hydrolase n=1 Tax=Moniliophthora roreri (strain MCA 2997) TaxID=1381753 RepID=V2Y2K2_MONRO|nr:epoxide hydrolase [Moniliophthora roreri MCA 2997]